MEKKMFWVLLNWMTDCRCLLWLTDRGDVCDHKIASLRHDGLQTNTLQTRGQFLPLVVQQSRQLLEVALWRPKHLVLSLKPLSYCLLLKEGTDEKEDETRHIRKWFFPHFHVVDYMYRHLGAELYLKSAIQAKILCYVSPAISTMFKELWVYLGSGCTIKHRHLMHGF